MNMKEYLKELFTTAQKMQLRLLWNENIRINIGSTVVCTGEVSFTIYVYHYKNGDLVGSAFFSVCEWCSADENTAQMAKFIDCISPYLT